jgi:hypothetical protein
MTTMLNPQAVFLSWVHLDGTFDNKASAMMQLLPHYLGICFDCHPGLGRGTNISYVELCDS